MTMRAPHYNSQHTIVSSSAQLLQHHTQQPGSKQHASGPSNSNAQRKDKILAERFKTQMCRNYERKGSCPYENKCMFAHGGADLRTPEMNVRDGLFTEESIEAFRRAQRLLKKRANQAARQQQQAAAAANSLSPNTAESSTKDNAYGNEDQIVAKLMDREDAVHPVTPAIHAESSSTLIPSESSSSVASSISSVGEQENADAFGSYLEQDDAMNQSVEEVLSTSCKMTSLLNNPNIVILAGRSSNGSPNASGSPSCHNTPRAGSRYRYNPYSASSSLSKV